MATRPQIESALVAAHKAGNADHARKLAMALKNMPAEQSEQPAAEQATSRPARLGAEGGLLAGTIPGEKMPGTDMAGTAIRYGAPFLASTGGPVGAAVNAGGEALAQMAQEGYIKDPGMVTAAGVTGAIPFAAPGALLRGTQNVARTVAGAVAGEEARSLVNTGELSDPTEVAAISGVLSAGAPIVGKVAGKLMGKVDRADAAAKAMEQSRNATRDASLKAGQEIGMVLPPTAVNDTFINRRLEGLAGGPRVGREATLKNNTAGGAALRKEAGLGPDAALGDDTFAALKNKAAEPYRRIAALSENGGVTMYHDGTKSGFLTTDPSAVKAGINQSAKVNAKNPLVIEGDELAKLPDREILDPDWKQKAFARGHDAIFIDNGSGRIDAFIPENFDKKAVIFKGTPIETAAADLEAMKSARNDAAGYYRKNVTNYDPNNIKLAKAAEQQAAAMEERIRTAALQSGDQKLMDDFIAARRQYAKLDDMERALNPDSGEFNLNKIGKLSQKGDPLTGNLKTVGDFANAFEGRFTRPSASIPNPGVSALEPVAMAGAGLAGGVKGLAVGTANMLLRDPLRAGLLSKTGQKWLATPSYKPAAAASEEVSTFARRLAAQIALQMGSQINEESLFLPKPVR
jgi:hypothetical protein